MPSPNSPPPTHWSDFLVRRSFPVAQLEHLIRRGRFLGRNEGHSWRSARIAAEGGEDIFHIQLRRKRIAGEVENGQAGIAKLGGSIVHWIVLSQRCTIYRQPVQRPTTKFRKTVHLGRRRPTVKWRRFSDGLRHPFWVLPIIKYRMHHNFSVFDCVEYGKREPPYGASTKI